MAEVERAGISDGEALRKQLGARLKALRLQAGLSQADLGELIRRAKQTLSDLERGNGSNPPERSFVTDYIDTCQARIEPETALGRERRDDLLRDLAALERLHESTAGRRATGSAQVPFMADPPPAGFVERRDEGEGIAAALTTGTTARDTTARETTVVVTGPGGQGKTTLVRWVCHQVRPTFPDGVLWVTLGPEPSPYHLVRVLGDLAASLTQLRPSLEGSVPAAADAFAAALANRRVLLVVDDAWRAPDVAPFLTGGPRCVRLVTTRRPAVVPGHHVGIRLGPMPAGEAAALLGPGLTDADRDALLVHCAGWPLGLTLAGNALRSLRRYPDVPAAAELLAELADRGVVVLDELTDDDTTPRVAATLELSVRELDASRGRDAVRRWAALAAFPDGAVIGWPVLQRLWGLGAARTRLAADQLIGRSLAEPAHTHTAADRPIDHSPAEPAATSASDENAAGGDGVAGDGVRLHTVVRDHLRRAFPREVAAASAVLLDADRPAEGWHALADRAARDDLVHHLRQAGLAGELDAVLTDARFLVARLRLDGPAALASDLGSGGGSEYHTRLLHVIRRGGHLLHGPAAGDAAATLHGLLLGEPEVLARLHHLREALPARGLVADVPLPGEANLGLVRGLSGHTGQVSSVAWRADGRLVSVGGDDRTVRAWDVRSGMHTVVTRFECGDVLRTWWSPDGRQLAALVVEPPEALPQIVVLDPGTGAVTGRLDLDPMDVFMYGAHDVAWSPDTTMLAVAGGDAVRFWSPAGHATPPPLWMWYGARALAWHPRSGLACLDWRGGLTVVSPREHGLPIYEEGHDPRAHGLRVFEEDDIPRALVWSPDGSRIVAAAGLRAVVLDVTPVGLRHASDVPFGNEPSAISWRPDGGAFAIVSNSVLGSWVQVVAPDPGTGDWSCRPLDNRSVGVLDVAWHPSDEQIAVAYVDSTVRLWHPSVPMGTMPDGLVPNHTQDHPVWRAAKAFADPVPVHHSGSGVEVTGLAGAPEQVSAGRELLTGTGIAVEWDDAHPTSTQRCGDLRVAANVQTRAFGFPDLLLIASGGSAVVSRPRCLAVDPAGVFVAACGETGVVDLFDAGTLERVSRVRLDEPAEGCAFDPSGRRLAVAGAAGTYLFQVLR